jgi:hypothetical protein
MMTREEIEELKGLAASMGLYDDKNPCKRAVILGKAIKALEQEPCEDAISRQAVLDIVDGYSVSQSNVEDITQDIISDIMVLPPVTPQPKIGHWILTSDDDCEYCTCSECGYQNGENWMIGSVIKFCQECGAKMVEPQESEGEG